MTYYITLSYPNPLLSYPTLSYSYPPYPILPYSNLPYLSERCAINNIRTIPYPSCHIPFPAALPSPTVLYDVYSVNLIPGIPKHRTQGPSLRAVL